MCETICSDTDATTRVSQQLRQQDRTLWGKIKDFFKGLVDRLKSAYKDMDPDSAIARQMKDTIRQSEAIRNAWVDAVSGGVENFRMQDGQKKNAQEGVKKSSKSMDSLKRKIDWAELSALQAIKGYGVSQQTQNAILIC